ncbi:sensor histidine kinase [Shouchella patagoniensis]|uniref:sensor histidine kinase n=1 Tax=Shouchella patagoniensis TaxID=228576 RepID=UPI000995B4E3|nr:histidine kinase [Shouchella patagoniensis]
MKQVIWQTVSAKINDMNIRNKLILLFLVGVVIPIMVVGLFLTNELKANAVKDAEEQAEMNVERVKQRIDEVLKGPITVANHLQFDERLSDLVNTTYENRFDVLQAYRAYPDVDYHLENHPEIDTIRLYVDNPTLLNNWTVIPVDNQMNMNKWYEKAEADVGFHQWHYLQDETQDNKFYLSLMKRINFIEYNTFGLLIITIDPDQLQTIMQQETHQTVVVDEMHSIVSSSNLKLIGKSLETIIEIGSQFEEDSFFESKLNGEPVHLMATSLFPELSQNELRIVSMVNTNEIVGDAQRLSRFGMLVTGMGATFALFLIMWFSWGYVNRLFELSSTMNIVSKGNLNAKVDIKGNDELGQIADQFNQMIEQLSFSLAQVLEANEQKNLLERKQDEMKFKMMASQINPHFLFNTLESIRMRALIREEKEIATVVKQLGKLLRRSLEVESKLIPMDEELEIVCSYLDIQSFRYGNRFVYRIDRASSIGQQLVLPLTIQPLVENAVSHGLEKKGDSGIVTISVKWCEAGILIKVSDNGAGMHKSREEEVKKMINDPLERPENRIGLRNVHQRLKMHYQTDGLRIETRENEGTTISYLIPVVKGREEEVQHV